MERREKREGRFEDEGKKENVIGQENFVGGEIQEGSVAEWFGPSPR